MTRERLVEMARTSMSYERAGTNQLMDGISRMPVSNYYDPVRWQREVDLVFKRLPLLLATSAELREPNTYKSIEVVGCAGADHPRFRWRGPRVREHVQPSRCDARGTGPRHG